MKTIIFTSFLTLFGSAAFADDIEVKIDSLRNIKHNGALEACGTAVSKSGVKPLIVTLNHDESFYTTLTSPQNDKWCILFKRWTYDGKVEVDAMKFGENSGTSKIFKLSNREGL